MYASYRPLKPALRRLRLRPVRFDFALLDINLGGNTSYEIGRRLKELGIAFAFASGYGEGVTLPDDLATYPVISKPYDKDALARLLD